MSSKEKIQIYIVGVIILVGIIFFIAEKSVQTPIVSNPQPQQNTDLPGLQTGPAPWDTSVDHLKDRLAAIGLPALSAEGTALHIHQHLDISVNGKPLDIPAHIGINEDAGFISTIHVHDTTGIIHVESPTIQTFTLGQFFDIWGVRFTPTCIGGYCASGSNILNVYVNGTVQQGNPRNIALEAHQEILSFMAQKTNYQK